MTTKQSFFLHVVLALFIVLLIVLAVFLVVVTGGKSMPHVYVALVCLIVAIGLAFPTRLDLLRKEASAMFQTWKGSSNAIPDIKVSDTDEETPV